MHKNSMKESILLWFARTEIYIFSKIQLLNLIEESHSSQTSKSEREQLISTPNSHRNI